MNIMYVSATVPYDSVAHAGGQTFNYYIKRMAETKNLSVRLISFCDDEQMNKLDVDKYGIPFVRIQKPDGLAKLIYNGLSINSKLNPFHKYGTIMVYAAANAAYKTLYELKNKGMIPDVIVLEWTQMVLLIDKIKTIFPQARIVASEHDVTFLGFRRLYENESNVFLKFYAKCRADNMYKRELNALNQCDLVFTHNQKDDTLLESAGVPKSKRETLVPFYHKSIMQRDKKNNDILFFGNMKRKENIQAALWFIDNVMNRLSAYDVRFVVIGGGPTQELIDRKSDKVIVTGYVENIDPYFAEAMCFVAPLKLGAGIKVKVIEALYTGIPVLTNSVGIEGIEAVPDKDYYKCETPEEYVKAIVSILDSGMDPVCGRRTITEQFDLDKSFDNYLRKIISLVS